MTPACKVRRKPLHCYREGNVLCWIGDVYDHCIFSLWAVADSVDIIKSKAGFQRDEKDRSTSKRRHCIVWKMTSLCGGLF